MLILVDIRRFIELTPTMENYFRISILAYWLDHIYGVLPPKELIPSYDEGLDKERVWQIAYSIEKEIKGIPLKLPVRLYEVNAMAIRHDTLFITVEDEDEFYRRNPELCSLRNTSSDSRRTLKNGSLPIGRWKGTNWSRRF